SPQPSPSVPLRGRGVSPSQRPAEPFVTMQRGMSQREKPDGAASPLVAVAIDKDKNSQSAFKWALDNVVTKGQTLTLVHVNTKPSSGYED
ncbi:unnamed protein product, partial [Musa hybrid cultivar]